MSKLKIGYIPNSVGLEHPADRRRLVYWANKRGHQIVLDLSKKHDALFLTTRADLTYWSERKSRVPLLLDLVDGYLGSEFLWKDWTRGIGKVVTGQNSGSLKPYRKILREACGLADAVVCETFEQRETIIPFCSNTHAILDFHEEFPMIPFKMNQGEYQKFSLMWEGLPFTAKGLLMLEKPLLALTKSQPVTLEIITDLQFPQFLGKYFYQDTIKILGNIPKNLGDNFRITEWELDAVVEAAKRSDLAVLPLDPSGRLNPLKAENRLLMMWRLGLPALTSPSLAYRRVMTSVGIDGICENSDDWINKLKQWKNSVELRRESVERGQQYIWDTHSEKKVLEAWDNLFESVL